MPIKKLLLTSVFFVFFSLSSYLQAHAMVAQHGTLNVIDEYAYLVLSLPVSAFNDVDDNKDGLVNIAEFNKHRKSMSEKILKQVVLFNKESEFTIDGLLLSPEIAHTGHENSIDQISITGRYTFKANGKNVYFNIGLFGTAANQKSFEITVLSKELIKGQKKTKTQRTKRIFTLTPKITSSKIF